MRCCRVLQVSQWQLRKRQAQRRWVALPCLWLHVIHNVWWTCPAHFMLLGTWTKQRLVPYTVKHRTMESTNARCLDSRLGWILPIGDSVEGGVRKGTQCAARCRGDCNRVDTGRSKIRDYLS
ncbi:hypothetical protein N656DRAFT_360649 [Canariomyces notabilis]|uniref:Uncharacterized protein n=1 Tax=Canariomyces notabilis TaxID=2074819 RepID=A0AAN6QGG3_9PEZI|nr:hypothetical protein N656DRAFT_360649 [Canariomyces arenarius]